MAKKSRNRPPRPKKDNAGCMSGLISMFDFRQGRFTQKLLPDRKYGSGRHGGSVFSKNKFDVLSNLEEKHEDINVTGSKRVLRDDLGKASIKALMTEEMSGARASKKIPSSRVEQLRADLGFGVDLEKNHKRKQNQNYKLGSNHDVDDSGTSRCTWSDPSESSSFDVNLAELMVEFCRENHEPQEKNIGSNGDRKSDCLSEPDAELTQNHYMLQKALRDIAETLMTQNSVDSKKVTSHGAVQLKDFMDALETLNSNKDVFLKLLQDPKSLLFKYILDLQNAETGEILQEIKSEDSASCQPHHKQTKLHFFRKKDKSDGTMASNESSQALKRIVVLKPSPARYEQCSNIISPVSSPKSLHNLQNHEGAERVSSHFSLKEIKRRLRNIVGESKKERDLIARDGVLHKIPYGFQNADKNSKTSSSTHQTSKLSALLKRGDNDSKFKQHQFQKKVDKPTVGHPSFRESVFYEEAKKRLYEMLSSDGQNGVSSPRPTSKSLGRILSLPGYNSSSPRFSPGRDKEVDSPVQTRSSTLWKIKDDDSTYNGSSTLNAEFSPCSDNNQDNEPQPRNSRPTTPEAQLHIEEVLIQEGSTRIETCESLDIPVEFNTDELGCSSERCNNEEGSPMISDSGASEEALPLTPSVSVSPNSILVQKLEAPESTVENLDRPSPVSVLEPFFSEDINSPERTETDHAELTAEPRQLSFEEHGDSQLVITSSISEANLRICTEDNKTKFKYVRTVLQASGLNLNKLSERWQLSDQLLDPFVFDEVEILYDQLIEDPKLLFDCVNEVLVEIRDRYLSCSPWLSSIKPNVRPTPRGENFVHEVCKGVDRHLQTVSPYTLDRVVSKDLEETWMNVKLETEGAVFEIGQEILEYIMEETILELWD